jgi:K+-transporting ATPase ATPase C chain
MLRHLKQAFLATLVVTLLCGLIYPLAMTGLAGVLFPDQAHGSLIKKDGRIIGSSLIGQNFTSAGYFHPRPSATMDTDPNDPAKQVASPYNAANSGASNYAPTAKGLVSDVQARVESLKAENPDARIPVPVDLVTSSASGLDPDISPAAAVYQAPRIAVARHVEEKRVLALITRIAARRDLGVLGEPRVNVLALNLALDDDYPLRP